MLVDLLAFLERAAAPTWLAGLTRFRARVGPTLSNAVLLTAVVAQVLLLPHLVRRSRRGWEGRIDRLLAVLGMLLLGSAALRATTTSPRFLLAEHGVLVATHLIVAAQVMRSRWSRPHAILATTLAMALATPLVWRTLLEWLGSESTVVSAARRGADAVTLLAFAATALVVDRRRPRRWMAAAVPALLAWLLLVVRFDEGRYVLASATGLWLTTFPPVVTSVLVAAAMFGVTDLLLRAWLQKRDVTFAAGVLLWCVAGFLPITPANVLLAFTGSVAVSRGTARGS